MRTATAHDAIAVTTAQARLHARDALVRNPLQKTHVKPQLVPLDGGALDADKRQGDAGLPVLGGLEDEVVERLTNLPAMSKGV